MSTASPVSEPLVSVSGVLHKDLYCLTRSAISEASLLPVLSRLDELLSLIRVASVAEDISHMNASILAKEIGLLSDQIRRLLVTIRTYRSGGFGAHTEHLFKEAVMLDEALFRSEAFDASRFGDLPSVYPKTQKPEGIHVTFANETTEEFKTTQNDIQKDVIKDTIQIQNDTKRQRTSKSQKIEMHKSAIPKETISRNRFSRQEEVLKILRVRKEVSIHDLTSYMPDCTVKTVQRILGDLIESGVVEKRGNKRWTTYKYKEV